MRKLTIIAICLPLAFAASGIARAQQDPPAPTRPQAPGNQSAPGVKSVTVLDKGHLSPELRAQVNALASQTSQDELQELRRAIDAMPMASSALKAKGLSSAQVIAAAIDDDGELTLVAEEQV
ncbi:hypothetical protein LJR009_000314 [Bosea sp. LjRoot9]|uniref:hypothetical protein n=1 Tax=Bosea sp. LjRoot9 TaxID=3342341 RepID=UPI003ECE0860